MEIAINFSATTSSDSVSAASPKATFREDGGKKVNWPKVTGWSIVDIIDRDNSGNALTVSYQDTEGVIVTFYADSIVTGKDGEWETFFWGEDLKKKFSNLKDIPKVLNSNAIPVFINKTKQAKYKTLPKPPSGWEREVDGFSLTYTKDATADVDASVTIFLDDLFDVSGADASINVYDSGGERRTKTHSKTVTIKSVREIMKVLKTADSMLSGITK